jgi:hypothetical protein
MSLSIQAGTTAIYSSTNSVFGNSKVSAGTATATKASASAKSEDEGVSAVSSQGDTLTISSAGSSLAANAISSDSDSSSLTDDLSQYTDYQLKQMLQNGEITQAEYDAEIQSRQED